MIIDAIEVYHAYLEAAMNTAEDKYFNARPSTDTVQARRIFRAGFERAFQQLWKPDPASGKQP